MIKIDNLTKLYKAKKKITCRALDGVSTVLPDKGLVFILGKSGSGKTTLLNLIGGLDSFDGGDIVSFGNSLSSFTEQDYETYRSDFVSFIFQDYHLIDELTVIENITLFNSEEVDADFLRSTLETVEMTEYVNRYPDELSGGQKQRVAIARGIIKDPKVILCDEPTGNLDGKTSEQIMGLLKKVSKEKLVIIVSHNVKEAENYADRIIELADGKIISDKVRDCDFKDGLRIDGSRAALPYHNRMDEAEVARLNRAISDGEVTEIEVGKSGFDEADLEYVEEKSELKLRRLGKNNIKKLFKKFFFSKYKVALSTVILSILMFGLFSIIQSFLNFDPNRALVDVLKDDRPIISVERDYSDYTRNIYGDLSELNGEDVYKLYNQTIWLNSPRLSSWENNSRFSETVNFESLYIHESYGVLLCDENYLKDILGKDGQIRLIAGNLDTARSSGVLITDYFAESIIFHEKEMGGGRYLTYESLIGVFEPIPGESACRIAGIIDTDYEEKFGEVFDKYNECQTSSGGAREFANYITDEPLYVRFRDDVMTNLGVAYSLNPNFHESFSTDETSRVSSYALYFASGKKQARGGGLDYMTTAYEGIDCDSLSNTEIAIPYSIYNTLFGTELTGDDTDRLNHVEKQTVKLRRYIDNTPSRGLLYEMEFTVVAVTESRVVCSRRSMEAIKRLDWQPSGIYVKEVKDIDKVVDFVESTDFRFISRSQRHVQRISTLVSTFTDLFTFLEVTTVFMITFFIILFGIRSIKDNSYQIGVIKALGGRNRDIEKIFVIKTFVIGIIVAILSATCSVFFVTSADSVLVASIEKVLGIHVYGFSVIQFIPSLIAMDGILMILLAFISALIPVIMLKRIKPVEIIKAKE